VLNFEGRGLRYITSGAANDIHRELEKEFKPGFMNMSEKDELSLDVHKRAFKEEKRRYCLAAYAIKTYGNDIYNWKTAHSAIEYIR
jgi:hypothetical protein